MAISVLAFCSLYRLIWSKSLTKQDHLINFIFDIRTAHTISYHLINCKIRKRRKSELLLICFISVKFLLWYPSRNTESTNLIKLAVNLSKRYSSDKRSWYIICMERYYVGSVHDSTVFLVAFSLDLSLLFSLKVILICFPVFIVKCYSREVSFRDQFSWLKFCIISWMQLYIFCESTY